MGNFKSLDFDGLQTGNSIESLSLEVAAEPDSLQDDLRIFWIRLMDKAPAIEWEVPKSEDVARVDVDHLLEQK